MNNLKWLPQPKSKIVLGRVRHPMSRTETISSPRPRFRTRCYPRSASESRKKLILCRVVLVCVRPANDQRVRGSISSFCSKFPPPHAGVWASAARHWNESHLVMEIIRRKKIIYWHVTFCNYHETVSVPKNAHAFGWSYQTMLCKVYPRTLQLISVLYPNVLQFLYQQHRKA